MKEYIRLMRPRHWIKNLLLFLPALFDHSLLVPGVLLRLGIGFACFSLTSSLVYIINDLHDLPADRQHPVKRLRPLAAGTVSPHAAVILAVVLLALTALGSVCVVGSGGGYLSVLWLVLYLALNAAYSAGLKNQPVLDIAILSMGFIIRLFYGAAICRLQPTGWLWLTVLSFSLYMALGKRRNELDKLSDHNTRNVLQYYTVAFLDKCMTIATTLGLSFYALWANTTAGNGRFLYTVPLVIFILMKYELILQGNSLGDPVDVLFSDKVLLVLVALYVALLLVLVFLPA